MLTQCHEIGQYFCDICILLSGYASRP